MRRSTNPADTDLDGIADGRDLTRVSLGADWRRDWTLQNGMIWGVLGEVTVDAYGISEDAAFQGHYLRSHGALATELRWPWIKAGKGGVTHVIEPTVQLVWSPLGTEALPNEDSALVEFDEANLFSLNRFPGSDATERGARANLGVSYLRTDADGWNLGMTFGRVFRSEDPLQFSAASGLDGVTSDWLAAVQLQSADGLMLSNRLLLDDQMNLTKGEVLLGLEKERYGITAGYLFMGADTAENRAIDTEELVFDGHIDLENGWNARLQNRYDMVADRTSQAGLGLGFRNECLAVDLSLSRRFTSSTSVTPTTDFSVSLELLGFGGAKSGKAGQCRG